MDFGDMRVNLSQQFSQTNNNTTSPEPRFPRYDTVAKRAQTFKPWPDSHPIHPAVLVDAGFVFTGVGDSVQCFYCGGGLRNWERGDSPWEEHAKWYPSCPYVHLVKGQNYVERVKRGDKPETDQLLREVDGYACDPINSPAAQACIQTGYTEDQVKKAITTYVKNTGGKLNFKAKDLCKLLLEIEEQQYEEGSISDEISIVSTSNDIPPNFNGAEHGNLNEEDRAEAIDNDLLSTVVEENRRLREGITCRKCSEDNANTVFLPCGHLAVCWTCSLKLSFCVYCNCPKKGTLRQCSKCAREEDSPIISLRTPGSSGVTCKMCS